ncbi:MAG: hypothetical protein M3N29_08570 [Chloroflexota bacterium]|nr:hypothetical protein [Chloroflexota bacterium]
MSFLHLLVAYGATVLAGATVLLALAGMLLGRRLRVWLDRLILTTLIALLAAATSGLPLLVLNRPPHDPLHLLYGVVGPLILLGGRYLGRHGSLRWRSLLVALAGVALLGVIFRLYTTAGGS